MAAYVMVNVEVHDPDAYRDHGPAGLHEGGGDGVGQ